MELVLSQAADHQVILVVVSQGYEQVRFGGADLLQDLGAG